MALRAQSDRSSQVCKHKVEGQLAEGSKQLLSHSGRCSAYGRGTEGCMYFMPLNWASNNGSRGEFYTTRILSEFYSRHSFPFLQNCTSSESRFRSGIILFAAVQVRYLISSWVSPPVHPGHVIIPQMFTEPLCGPSALSLHLPHLCHGTRDRYICMHLSVYRLDNQLQIVLKLHTRLV